MSSNGWSPLARGAQLSSRGAPRSESSAHAPFGHRVTYEPDTERCVRAEAYNKGLTLDREKWARGQSAPHYSTPSHRTETAFRFQNYSTPGSLNENFGEYAAMPAACADSRQRPRSAERSFALAAPPPGLPQVVRRLDHGKSRQGVWEPSPGPLTAREPYVEVSKFAFHNRQLPIRQPVQNVCFTSCPKSTRIGKRRSISIQWKNDMKDLLREAARKAHPGRNLESIFLRVDMDGSGSLDEVEMKEAFRRVLKIPHDLVSDGSISTICQAMPQDSTGAIKIADLVKFIG